MELRPSTGRSSVTSGKLLSLSVSLSLSDRIISKPFPAGQVSDSKDLRGGTELLVKILQFLFYFLLQPRA